MIHMHSLLSHIHMLHNVNTRVIYNVHTGTDSVLLHTCTHIHVVYIYILFYTCTSGTHNHSRIQICTHTPNTPILMYLITLTPSHPHHQSRLAELYQRASEEARAKVEELISGAESMQRLLEEVSQEKEKYELQLNEATIRYIQ